MTPKTLGTALLTATLAGTASADVATAYYTSSSNYGFEIEHMPDFDQVRNGLDDDSSGDPGGMFCVPTSLTNLLGYIGNHGFPSAGPNGADWENDEDYDLITTYIANMGALAGTTGVGGTSHEPAYEAMKYFLSCTAPGVFTVTENLATNTTGPTLRSIAENNVNGAISSLCYGIYDDLGNDVWGRKVLDRNGGHCISFVRGYRNGSTREIAFMDPDDSSDASTQSTFGAEDYDVEQVEFVKSSSLFSASFLGDRKGSRIMRTWGGKYRMIDCVIHVKPRCGYSWSSSERQWILVMPDQFAPWMSNAAPVPGPFGRHMDDFTPGPFNNTIWYLDDVPEGKAYYTSLGNHEVESFPIPHEGVQLAFARDHALILLGDGVISRLHPYAQSSENAPEPITMTAPTGLRYLAMEDAGDNMWLAGPDDRMIYRASQRLDTGPVYLPLPDEWPTTVGMAGLAASGDPSWPLALLGDDGRISLCKETDGRLIKVAQIWGDGPVSSIQFNDEGDLMSFGELGVRMYRADDNIWREVQDHPFKDMTVAGPTVMARSRTNFDPQVHGGEEWAQIRDLEPVAGDIDGDGSVSVTDLLEVIGHFGEQSDTADLDGDGIVTVEDMLIVIANWSN